MITSFPNSINSNKIGSVLKFYFVPVEDILTEPEIYNGVLLGAYTFKPAKSLLTGYFDSDSAKLDIADNTSYKGDLMKSVFHSSLSFSSTELDALLCAMRSKKFIVFVADHNKIVRVLGRTYAGCIFTFNFTTNKKREDAPMYEFKFSYESACCVPVSTQITGIC